MEGSRRHALGGMGWRERAFGRLRPCDEDRSRVNKDY